MRSLVLSFILFAAVAAFGQSGRTAPTVAPTDSLTAVTLAEQSVKQLFDEVNGYIRAKGAAYDAKKVFFSDRLFTQAKLEQRQLAAQHAATVELRKDLTGDDLYYLGMLHWVGENWNGTVSALRKFTAGEDGEPARKQTARSVAVVALAKQTKLDEAESLLADYVKMEPVKLTERARMEGELAKAYQAQNDLARMAPHAEAGYAASKALLKDAASRARGLDEILDAGMLVYEAFRDLNEQKKAEDALDDMRSTAASVQSPSFYYYAVDQKIKYMIDTGRKIAATEVYQNAIESVNRDFADKDQRADALARLKKRAKHYSLLGSAAPEFLAPDQIWFPGNPRTIADMRGKVVLLDFWATWCAPCFEAFPFLIEMHQDLKPDGLEIIGVTRFYGKAGATPADEPRELEYLKAFRQKERLPYDFVVARGQSIQLLYDAMSLPTAVLIDRKGKIRYIESGTSPQRLEQMREMIFKLLAEK